MFVVKDPDAFAEKVIPQYFDHNKFSSFARQLNFYGFRKMQSKPIRNVDYDAGTAKHVTFYNENFKRGRCDLLKKIQRSTRGGGTAGSGDHSKEIQELRAKVATLEETISTMGNQMEERMRRLELDMLSRMEQMMVAMTAQQQQNSSNNNSNAMMMSSNNGIHPSRATSNASISVSSMKAMMAGTGNQNNNMNNNNGNNMGLGWDPLPFGGGIGRGTSLGSISMALGGSFQAPASVDMSKMSNNNSNIQNQNNHMNNSNGNQSTGGGSSSTGGAGGGPTLPPHPKMKQLPTGGGPADNGGNDDSGMGNNTMQPPPDIGPVRLQSLRGISALSRGISGLSRGASIESIGSTGAGGMRNAWEDKFFSMLLSGDQQGAAQQLQQNASNNGGNNNDQQMLPTPMSNRAGVSTDLLVSHPYIHSFLSC